jgi:hypothetical protein
LAAQPFAALLQPPLERADRPTQLTGRLVARLPSQIAQDQRGAKALGQTLQFRVQDCQQFPPRDLGEEVALLSPRRLPLVSAAVGAERPGFDRGAIGHLVKPRRQGRLLADRVGRVGKSEEGGLEGVVGVGVVAEHAPAHPQHQRAVPPY